MRTEAGNSLHLSTAPVTAAFGAEELVGRVVRLPNILLISFSAGSVGTVDMNICRTMARSMRAPKSVLPLRSLNTSNIRTFAKKLQHLFRFAALLRLYSLSEGVHLRYSRVSVGDWRFEVNNERLDERQFNSLLKRSPSAHSITTEYTFSGLAASICVY
jgi:hypothetical protein